MLNLDHTWSMVWLAPVARSSGGRSAVSRIKATPLCEASTTAGSRFATAVPDDVITTAGALHPPPPSPSVFHEMSMSFNVCHGTMLSRLHRLLPRALESPISSTICPCPSLPPPFSSSFPLAFFLYPADSINTSPSVSCYCTY